MAVLVVAALGSVTRGWLSGNEASSARSSNASARLAIEFAGCAVVRAGARCELHDVRALAVWAHGEQVPELRTARGALRPSRVVRVDGGARLELQVPAGAQFVEVRQPHTGASARVQISDGSAVPLLREAAELRAQGKLDAAHARLSRGLETLSPELKERARALLARIALSRGEFQQAARGLEASLAAAYGSGRISDALQDATALAYVLCVNLHEYARAREVLERAAQAAAQDPSAPGLLAHYGGLLALETGDLRGALQSFREATRRTERLGLESHELLAHQGETSALALLGRHVEAMDAQRAIIARTATGEPCRALDAREHLVWLGVLAQLSPASPHWSDIAAAEREATAFVEACSDPWRRRNHWINAGLLALNAQDVPAASTALRELSDVQGGQDVLLRTWQLELTGRVALAERRFRDARAAYEQALGLAQRAGLWSNEHLAQLGLGRSLEGLGRPALALEAYMAADRLLDRLLGGVPLGEGLGGFLHGHEDGTRQLIALLVEHGNPERAFTVARRARARLMRSISYTSRIAHLDSATKARWESAIARYRSQRAALEQAQASSWQLPADALAKNQATIGAQQRAALEALDAAHALLQRADQPDAENLRAPAEGEALLGLFPRAGGVIAFVARGRAVSAHALPVLTAAEPAGGGAAWLEPIADRLRGVARVTLLLHGSLVETDVHAFELGGAPLIEQLDVQYGTDAPTRDRAHVTRGALVVADPTSDLPAALREGQGAREALGPGTTLLSGVDASRDSLLPALTRAAVLHYAGHGQQAGLEGVESGLQLAHGWLSIGDVLALPSVPPLVVLSACEGASGAAHGFSGSLGVAEAFVAAGARSVVAATRPVADDTARALFDAFYAARAHDPDASPTALLRHAQRQLRRERPRADWASFRVLVP